MGAVFVWWLLVLVMGLAAFPLAFVSLRHFPDKGYVFSKVLALLLVGYLSWLLGYFSFNGGTVLLSILIVAALSALLLFTWIKESFFDFFKKNLFHFMLVEVLFLTAFLVAGAYKMRTHDIAGTEKPMDFAMINGILASPSMPPQDPWLSGGSISYYYFGYFIVAVLEKLTQSSVTPGEAYNAAVALIWALAALCTFSLAYALTRRYRYSLLSAACLTLFGNMDYWHRVVQSFQVGDLRVPYYNFPTNPGTVTGFSSAIGFLFSPLRNNWDYFQASRIIPVPPGDKMINEFPSFSFFLSDLHPHVMAIPFVLLAMALAFNLLKAPLPGLGVFGGRRPWQIFQWFLLALAFGALSFMNSWDFPTFLFLLGACLFLQQWWANGNDLMVWGKSIVLLGVPIVMGAIALYLPFYAKFQSQARGLGVVKDRTDLYYLMVLFGLFFAVAVPALWGKAFSSKADKNGRAKQKRSEEFECVVCGKEGSGKKFCGHCGGELVPSEQVEVTPIPHDGARESLQKAGLWFSAGSDPWLGWIATGAFMAVLIALNFGSLNLATFLFGVAFVAICGVSLASKSDSKEMIFAILSALTAFLLLAGCEVLFIQDHFSTGSLYRMNTMFKLHYQVWILLSVAIAPLLKWLLENQWPQWAAWKKLSWSGVVALVFLGGALYPAMAFTARMRTTSADMVTLDGAAFYEHVFPADYQAAKWIMENIKPVGDKIPVILEAWGGSYHQEYARIATVTGYPTVLGWDFHEAQWRGSWDKAVVRGKDPDDTIMKRQADVDAIYTSSDINQARELMKKYGINYVYVGDIERQKYKDHLDGLGKFAQVGAPIQSFGGAVLYKINP